MAFGQKASDLAKQNKGSGDGEQKTFESQFMPTGPGMRTFRVLPEVVDGEVKLTPRLSNGIELRKGGKKTGEVLLGPEPAEEVPFLAAWWNVMVNGELKPRRLILDIYNQWGNPLWQHVQKNFEKGAKERKVIKKMFAMNVWDKTPVLINSDGQIFYPDEKRNFTLAAIGPTGKLITDKSKLPSGDPEPLNKVRILEGSYGDPGGKHLFQQFLELVNFVEDSEGLIRRLPEFDLRLVTTGEGINTNRSIRNLVNFEPLPKSAVLAPRYDLVSWLKPWPDEMITRLLEGEDYNELVQEYDIQLYPKLEVTEDEDAPDPTNPDSYKSKDDEGVFDD